MRYLYTVIFYLCVPAILLRLLYRSIRMPAYRRRIPERFGWIPKQQHGIWLHAVSLGEAIAATPLIKALLERYPNESLLVTNMTPTGSNYIRQTFGQQVSNTYVPYDLPTAVKRFLQTVRPRLAIMMETELWPNLFQYCSKANIPILIANARLSARSAKGYAKIKPLVKIMLQKVNTVACQTQADAQRFIDLGLPSAKALVVGNIKFDLHLPHDLSEQAHKLRTTWGGDRPIWIAASTHEGEETIVLQAFAKVKSMLPDCLLLLVPRHPERFKTVSEMCRKLGHKIALRSTGQDVEQDTSILIGDTMGELKLLYACSDLALVGGSLVPIGGHNLLEPAAVGIPALTGPFNHNFIEVNRLLQGAGVVKQIAGVDDLAQQVVELLSDSEKRQTLGAKAQQLVAENKGAVQKHIQLIERL
jgi:3-deoxy-D-manno-octulosonic-acid transferase